MHTSVIDTPVLDRRYHVSEAKRLGMTQNGYIARSRSLYVILEGGLYPQIWDDGTPRLYDSFNEAAKECLADDQIVSEYAFIKAFCK